MLGHVHCRESLSGRFRRSSVLAALATVTFFAGYIARGAADVATPQPIRIDPAVAMKEKQPYPKDELVAGSPALSFAEHIFYSSPQGTVRVGVAEYDSTGSSSTVRVDMPIDEYVHAVEGRVIVRADDGRSWSLKKGDALLVPQGFKGTATIVGHFRNEFVRVERPVSPATR